MSKLKIEAEIDATDLSHVEALGTFLKTIGGHIQSDDEIQVKKIEVVSEEVEKDKPKADKAPNDANNETPDYSKWTEEGMKDTDVKELRKACKDLGIDFAAVEGKNTNAKLRGLILDHFAESKPDADSEEEQDDAPKDSTTEYTRDDVRTALRSKIDDYKPELKKKLKELGASNISGLKEKDFIEFIEYANSL